MMTRTLFNRIFQALCVIALLGACSGESINNDSPPEKQYEEGLRLMKKERFTEAVERFRVLKSRFPYSKFAALAALKIGDTHYLEESYIESASAYKIFRELYPKHEMASYALYRIGESQYNLVPESPDRDLDSASAAIDAYKQLVKDYPDSPYVDDCKKKLAGLQSKLADKEDYVGNFYFIREQYLSAAGRYRRLLDQFPDSPYTQRALYRLSYSYEQVGEFAKSSEALDRLLLEFPNEQKNKDVAALKSRLQKEMQQ